MINQSRLHVAVFDENWFYVEEEMVNTYKYVKIRRFYDKIMHWTKDLKQLRQEVNAHTVRHLPTYKVRAKFRPPLYLDEQEETKDEKPQRKLKKLSEVTQDITVDPNEK